MSSPAKRRRDRLARRRRRHQVEARYWAKREARGVHVISPTATWFSDTREMRDVSPASSSPRLR